jgi:NADPH:quinone reductase-like Zn-dependent oxidoreductase
MQLGAAAVVPRGEDMGRTVRSMYAAGVDAAWIAHSWVNAAAALVRDGGSLVSVRSSQKYGTPRVNVKYIGVLQQALDTDALTWVAARAQEHVLTPRVAQTFAFSDAAQAHRSSSRVGCAGESYWCRNRAANT